MDNKSEVKRVRKPKKIKNVIEVPISLKNAISSKGKTLLLKHFQGEHMPASQAIQAKCCECNGYWIDGRSDCMMPSCPLYAWQPYKGKNEKIAYEDEAA